MWRVLAGPVAVVAVDGFVLYRTAGDVPWWVTVLRLVAVGTIAVVVRRVPPAGFLAALAAAVTGGAYALLAWAGYQAGARVSSRWGLAVLGAGAVAAFGAQMWLARTPAGQLVGLYVVFALLPVVLGRSVAQRRTLRAAVADRELRLRRERRLLAERERLRERLRVARDVHDSLGHRLGLISVQAAALEVAELPASHQEAVRRLAGAARTAMDELHELVGALRSPDAAPGMGGPHPPGTEPEAGGPAGMDELFAGFRAAGVPLTVRTSGEPAEVPSDVARAAYRVAEEGLTNAAKHAPGKPVTVNVHWEDDSLLLTLANPLPGAPEGTGYGLVGLTERVRLAGGMLHVTRDGGEFRLVAMLPTVPEPEPDSTGESHLADVARAGSAMANRMWVAGLAVTVAALALLSGPMGGLG
ncbi:histidine kinase [Sphaerisporangium sp. B11E5]|uniref:sensor histidine kinase n=1 Tax=Sphaerisporangium sp. B11E5 TaxID=3153563 RepID=UPI00325F3F49